MPVTIEEMAGSPKFSLSDGQLTIKRQVKITWTDLDLYMDELFPEATTVGNVRTGGVGAAFPGRPHFRVRKFDIIPFHEARAGADGQDGFGVQAHEHALVDIEYAVPPFGTLPDTGFPPANFDPKELLDHQMTSGGQFLTTPATGFEWEGLAEAVPEGTIKGMFVPTTEHHVTDHVVEDPNWYALELYKGKVNEEEFILRGFPYPAETLLYMGYDAKISYKSFTLVRPQWSIQAKFSAKVVELTSPFIVEGVDNFYGGHNHFWNEDLQDWNRVIRTGTEKGMYLRVDFAELFKSGTQAAIELGT